jgi:hypothetical protein
MAINHESPKNERTKKQNSQETSGLLSNEGCYLLFRAFVFRVFVIQRVKLE